MAVTVPSVTSRFEVELPGVQYPSHPGVVRGLRFPVVDVLAINRSGGTRAIGDVVEFDLANADGDVTSNILNQASGGFANFLAPTATGLKFGIHAVCLEATTDNALGRVRIEGIVQAFVIRASSNISKGDPLIITTAYNLDGISAAGEKYVATALDLVTGPSSRILARVLFRGFNTRGVKV